MKEKSMDEKSYTAQEFRQALRETGNTGLAAAFTDGVIAQMDKNRSQGFTEEQVRTAVAESVHEVKDMHGTAVRVRGLYGMTETFVNDVIARLRGAEKPAEPADGGVYRSPSRVLYRRSAGRWQMFGMATKFTDDELNFPWTEMERVQ